MGEKVRVMVYDRGGRLVGPVEAAKVVRGDDEWAALLTPEQYRVARRRGTEEPFCGTLLGNERPGVYSCVCCGLPLFASSGKFDSGTGWPGFVRPVAEANVVRRGRPAEALCARCDAHLGHAFGDGPPPDGLRYCINSASLAFTGEDDLASLADPAAGLVAETAP